MSPSLSPHLMRLFLLLCLLGMELQAALFLSQRRLPFLAYLGWGLLAVLLPVVGPFLVILRRPGRRWPRRPRTRRVRIASSL